MYPLASLAFDLLWSPVRTSIVNILVSRSTLSEKETECSRAMISSNRRAH